MEFVSVCPLRLGASLTARGHALELKVVVKATLEPAERKGALELAEYQPSPEGAERALVDEEVALSRAVRRLPGVEVGERRWRFEGAPPGMESQELPEISPRLFVVHAGASREVMLETHAVEVNPVTGWVTVLWSGAVALARAESAGTIVLAMERSDELVTLADVMNRTRGLDPASLEQRGRAVVRGFASAEFLPLPSAPGVGPLSPPGPTSPPKRSIGQMMLDAPSTPMSRSRLRPEPEEVAPARVAAPRTVRGHEVIWIAGGTETALRRHPTWRKLLPKRSADDEPRRALVEVGSVALRGAALSLDELPAALRDAVSDGILEPPLVIVEGELCVAIDPVEELRAWAVNALAVAPNDERVKASVAAAIEAIDSGDPPPAQTASRLAAVRASVSAAAGASLSASLERAIGRALARERKTERVSLRPGEGSPEAPHVRATIRAASTTSVLAPLGRPSSPGPTAATDRVEVRVYLPVDAADKLPLLASLEARLLARVRPPLEGRGSRAPILLPLAILRVFTVDVDDAHSTPSTAPARIVTP